VNEIGIGCLLVSTDRRRVLIVDDDADGRISLRELLAVWGYDAEEAHDGARAIELSLVTRPDIVVLDLGLPDRDGVGLIARFKAEGAFVIAYSGWQHLRAGAHAAGADAFVLKPEILELRAALAAAKAVCCESEPARKKSIVER
jgi:CheY-like chemotaxis protein